MRKQINKIRKKYKDKSAHENLSITHFIHRVHAESTDVSYLPSFNSEVALRFPSKTRPLQNSRPLNSLQNWCSNAPTPPNLRIKIQTPLTRNPSRLFIWNVNFLPKHLLQPANIPWTAPNSANYHFSRTLILSFWQYLPWPLSSPQSPWAAAAIVRAGFLGRCMLSLVPCSLGKLPLCFGGSSPRSTMEGMLGNWGSVILLKIRSLIKLFSSFNIMVKLGLIVGFFRRLRNVL